MEYTDIFFILALLPLSVIISFFDSSAEYKNMISIIAGLIFIAWGRPIGVLVICLSFIFDWTMGLLVGAARKKSRPGALFFLLLDLVFNAAVFIVYTRGSVITLPEKLTLEEGMIPLAMGYYVLRAFSYVFDVYKGEEAERNPLCILTYMVSYHFMMCGPVIRYKDIKAQMRERRVDGRMLSEGFNHIVYGLAKVVLVAYALDGVRLTGLEAKDVTLFGCWLGMAAFFGEAYFTLSGLCEMSLGMGLMNGFTYKRNFEDIDSRGLFTGLVKGYNSSVTSFFEEAVYSPFRDKKAVGAVMAFICCVLVAGWYSFSKTALLVGAIVGAVVALEKLVLGEKLGKLPAGVRYIYMTVLSMLIFGVLYFGNIYGWRKWAFGLVGVGDKYLMSKQMKRVILSDLFIYIAALIYFIPTLRRLVTGAFSKLQKKSAQLYTFIETSKSILRAVLLVMSIAAILTRKM